MALVEGTYLIINAKSGMALDVKGGSDKSGSNVQQWNVNRSDAQIWALTEQDDGWQAICSLTGRSLDVAGGTMANKQNVQQWSDNNSLAQRWEITADGNSYTYGGTSYPTYTIKCKKGTTFALDVANGSTTAGANIQIYTANGSVAQRWVFVPVLALTEGGTFELVSALDTSLCVDISGGSTANGAKAQVYTRNGTNAQVFEANVDSQNMLVRIVSANSGKALDSNGAAKNGTQVHQWAKTSTVNQWWLVEKYGSVKVDGITWPTYILRAQANSGRVMDVAGAKKAAGTKLQVYDRNATAAQRFAFVRTEMLGSSIPAPSRSDAVLQGIGTLEHSIGFVCDETAYQARFRTRTWSANHRTVTTSKWKSLDGQADAGRGGWGDAWTPTFEVSSGGSVVVPTPVSATLVAGSRDLVVVDVEIRAFRESYGSTGSYAHGPVTRSTVTFTLQPTVAVDSVAMAVDGLKVDLSCDYPHAGNRYSVELWQDGERIAARETVSGNGSATVTVPFASLGRLPRNGQAVEVRASVVTAGGGSGSCVATKTVSWSETVTTVTPTVTYDSDTLTAIVTCSGAAGGSCLLEITDSGIPRLVECPEVSSGVWRVPYPLGAQWSAHVLLRASGGWKLGTVEGQIFDSDEYVWNWGDGWGECLRLRANADDRPRQSREHDSNSSTVITTGRARPIAFAARTVSLDLSVEAATFGDSIPHSTRSDVERLVWTLGDGWYPVYRTPKGDWHRVAVTGASTGWDNGIWCHAEVEQQAVEP